MSERRMKKERAKRDKVDSNFEQTPVRIAFQAWRDAEFPITGELFGAWIEANVGGGQCWRAFRDGYERGRRQERER